MQIPLVSIICTTLTQIQQSFVVQTPSTNSKPALKHFWRPTTAGKLPHSTRIGRENVAKFIKFCIFSERKKNSQFLASTSNYQLELVIGTYPTFSEQRILSSDSEKSRKTTKINFLLQNIQTLWWNNKIRHILNFVADILSTSWGYNEIIYCTNF